MVNEFKLPDVGEGLTEAEIVTWKVKVGDEIRVNDIVCEIETAKSLVELPSPYAGTVQALLVPEGETVAVGTPIIRIGAAGSEAEPASGADGAAAEDDDEQPMTLVGSGPKESAVVRRPRRVSSGAAAAHMQAQASFEPGLRSPDVEAVEEPPPAVPEAAPTAPAAATRALAKPPVRKLAKDLGVDLATITPAREDGVVTRQEVEAAAAGTSYAPAAPAAGSHDVRARETREPIKGVRKMMGQAMVDSAFSAPHVTIWTTIDATGTVELVERLRTHRDFRDVRVSPTLIVAKACLLALRRTPLLNSTWDDAAQEIVLKHYVNLGIAAATPRGLVVPHVKDAQDLTLVELAAAINGLVATAREGKTPPSDMAGGTFSITNVGPFGMDAGTPILNPGESGILCFGAIKRQPWVVDDQVVPRDVCTLALSFDHRHVDGETGSRFLADVAAIVSDPATGLLF